MNVYIKELRDMLLQCEELYRKGEPLISDIEFDGAVAELKELSPDDEFFAKGILPVPTTERMQKLPLPMFSLEKIKEVTKLRQWVNEMKQAGAEKLVFMPKYDGISLLVDGVSNHCWTRGDGSEGQRSDKHYKKMFGGVDGNRKQDFIYSWGEALFLTEDFIWLQNNDPEFAYKSNRNAVAGIFNSPKGYSSKYLPYIHFVRYGSSIEKDKVAQIEEMGEIYYDTASYCEYKIDEILEYSDDDLLHILNEVYYDFKEFYPTDGIVIEVNELKVQTSVGRLPNDNPRYAIAFKRDEWLEVFRAKVIDIELGVGKTGVINPVIIIEPVVINGVTVRRCTAHNMSILLNNHISIGAVIEIIRGGEVIPKFIRTVSYIPDEFTKLSDSISRCPSCGQPVSFNEAAVDMICTNKMCPEKVISQITFFFRTMGCEEFDEPSVRKLYFLGNTSIEAIVSLSKEGLQLYLGSSKGETVHGQICKVCGGVSLARFMTSMNWFEGVLAETTCQKIFDGIEEATLNMIENRLLPTTNTESKVFLEFLQQINGIGDITALAFLKGYKTYCEYNVPFYKITHVKTPVKALKDVPNRLCVCLTGFRDKELVEKITQMGHIALNDVTKDCNLLVVADINSTSSKMKTAVKRGIRVLTKEDFINEVLV